MFENGHSSNIVGKSINWWRSALLWISPIRKSEINTRIYVKGHSLPLRLRGHRPAEAWELLCIDYLHMANMTEGALYSLYHWYSTKLGKDSLDICVLKIMKLENTMVDLLSHSHNPSKWKSMNLNPGLFDTKVVLTLRCHSALWHKHTHANYCY